MVELKLLRRGRRSVATTTTTTTPVTSSTPPPTLIDSSIDSGNKTSSSFDLSSPYDAIGVAGRRVVVAPRPSSSSARPSISAPSNTQSKEPAELRLVRKVLESITSHLPSHSTRSSSRYSAISQAAIRDGAKALQGASQRGSVANVLSVLLPELERPGGAGNGSDNARFPASSVAASSSAPLLSSLDVLRSHRELLRITARCLLYHWSAQLQSSELVDPPALDESLARRLLQVVAPAHPTRFAVSSAAGAIPSTPASIATLVVEALKALRTGRPDLAEVLDPFFSSSLSSSSSDARDDLRSDIHHYSLVIVYFLSATNWSIVHSLIKQRIAGHSTLTSNSNSSEAKGEIDANDLRILEACCLSRNRLSVVFQASFNAFLPLNKPAQLVLVHCLRTSIWSWITSFPNEFSELSASGRRIEGGCDMLFDLLWAQCSEPSTMPGGGSGATRKMAGSPSTTWSTMMMLLLCCPDIVAQLLQGGGGADGETRSSGGYSKKMQFLEALKKALVGGGSSTTNNDATWESLVDLLLASTSVYEGASTPAIKALANDFAKEFVKTLLDALETSSSQGPSRIVLTRCLVAIAKLDLVDSGVTGLFERLLQTTSPLSYQLAAINALLILTSETSTKSVQQGLATLARPLVPLFEHAVHSPRARRNRTPSAIALISGGPVAPEEDSSTDLVRAILLLWTRCSSLLIVDAIPVDQTLVLVGKTTQDALDETFNRLAFKLILQFFRSSGNEVVAKAREDREIDWSGLGKFVAHRVLEADDGTVSHKLLLQVLLEVVKRWRWIDGTDTAATFWATLEASLIVSVHSPSTEVRDLALECARFAVAARAAALPPTTTLKSLAQPRPRTADRNEALDRLKSFVRDLDEPPIGLLIAWDEMTLRTSDLSVHLVRNRGVKAEAGSTSSSSTTILNPVEISHSSSLTGMLLVMSAVCTRKPGPDDVNVDARLSRRNDRIRQANSLVQELLDLVVSEDQVIRHAAVALLGSDLDLRQLGSFVSHLKRLARHLAPNRPGSGSGAPPPKKLLVTQSMLVLQALIDRVRSQPLPKDVSTPLADLLVTFAEYLDSLSGDEEKTQLQAMFCRLCESVYGRPIEPATELLNRAKLVDYLYRWLATMDDATAGVAQRALAGLFKALVLRDENGAIDRALFNRYFDRLIRSLLVLDKQSETAPIDAAALTERRRTRSALLDGLAELLISNPEPTQRRIAEMTSARDASVRLVYLEVLKILLDRGVKFDATKGSNDDNVFGQIIELVRHNTPLALALCEVCSPSDYDDLIEVLLRILATPQAIASFLRAVIAEEVQATDHESTLFRGNTFASRLLTIYSKAQGYHYLRDTLKNLLLTLCQKPPEFNLDFDPHRDSPADDTASRNLIQITEAFLVCISQSADWVPFSIREICGHIAELVGARFPESVYTAVGGFIFLRFINPAIVSPETIDLDLPAQTLASDTREVRKGLVSISKVLQALANNVRFGAKEPGMRALNPFMDRNIFTMTNFLSAMSRPPVDARAAQEVAAIYSTDPESPSQGNLAFLHGFLVDHCSKIGAELLGRSKQKAGDPDAADLWEHLTGLIAALGPRSEVAPTSRPAGSQSPTFHEFMARNAFRLSSGEGSKWSQVFYPAPAPLRVNSTLFVLLASKIDTETIDIEGLAFWVLHSLASGSSDGWDVLIDLTGFSRASEIAPTWVQRFLEMLPESVGQHLSQVIIYSSGFSLRAYLRRLEPYIGAIDPRRVVAYGELEDLEQAFPDIGTALPPSTLATAREHRVTFGQITLKHPVKVEVPIVLKIGTATLAISTVKPQMVSHDVASVFCDAVPLGSIEDVRHVTSGVEGDMILLRVLGEARPRRFLVKSRSRELLAYLRAATSTKGLTVKLNGAAEPLALVVSFAIKSLAVNEDDVRTAGHRLVRSIGKAFSATGLSELADVQGLYVPSNDLALMASVSDVLSTALPPRLAFDVVERLIQIIATTSSILHAVACIHGLRAWLHNLASSLQVPREVITGVHTRIRRALRSLLKTSLNDPTLSATLSARIWPAFGRLEMMHEFVLDEAVHLVVIEEAELIESTAALYADILVALAGGATLRGRVLSRLRQALMKKASRALPGPTLEQEYEIVALLRFDLSLSFDSKMSSQLFLPEILHVIMSLAGEGPLARRQLIRKLLLNTINALALDREADHERLAALMKALASDAVIDLFGLPAHPMQELPTWDALRVGDRLALALGEVVDAAAPTIDTKNAWRSRWASLASSLCFQYDFTLQMRAIVMLTYLGTAAMDDDVVFQLLTTLGNAIRSPHGLTLAALLTRCLSRIIQADSKFLLATADAAMALLLLRSSIVVHPAVALLAVSIEKLQASGAFASERALDVLAEMRRLNDANASSTHLDARVGVNADVDLGFALASLLLQPLREANTMSDASYSLLSVIHYSPLPTSTSKDVSMPKTNWLGPFIVLLPSLVAQGRLAELTSAARMNLPEADDPSLLQTVAQALAIPDRTSAMLALALSAQLLEEIESDDAAAALFFVVAHILDAYPDLLDTCSDTLARILDLHLSRPITNMPLYDAINTLNHLFSSNSHQSQLNGVSVSSDVILLDQLAQLGFRSLAPTGARGRYSIDLGGYEWTADDVDGGMDHDRAELVSTIISHALAP